VKRVFSTILAWVFLTQTSFAAFHASTSWEVRTTGSDNNGGGFHPAGGSAEVTSASDLVIDGANNKLVTSATHNFVAGDVGKSLHVLETSGAGWIFGWYTIVSTGSNAATLNESPGAVGLTAGKYSLWYGLDYSQQDAAEHVYTDLVIGNPNTTATSAARPFSYTDTGNIINVLSGTNCTVQRAQISSVSAGAVATFDKALGTIASTCTGNFGGALLTLGTMGTSVVDMNEVYVKAGTYTITTMVDLRFLGVVIYGYQTTRGDNGTKPLITTATDSTALFQSCGGAYTCGFHNLSFSNTAATREAGILARGGTITVVDSLFDGFTTGINASALLGSYATESLVVRGTEVKNSSAYGIAFRGPSTYSHLTVVDSYIHHNSTAGLFYRVPGQADLIRNRITYNGIGIYSTSNTITWNMTNNTVANNTSDGFGTLGTQVVRMMFVLSNNIFYGNGGWGLQILYNEFQPLDSPLIITNNAYGSNASGNYTYIGPGTNEIALTADPFTDAVGGDFTLNSDAGGGELLKATGTPAYLDIGALQSQGSVAGAHGSAFVQ